MSKTVLSIPVEAQMTVVNTMVLPLLERTGIDVQVSPTKSGMTLALTFREPVPATANGDDPDKKFSTDSPEQAAAFWELKARVEEAQRVHAAHHAPGLIPPSIDQSRYAE